MVEFIIGAAVGAGGMLAKELFVDNNQNDNEMSKKRIGELSSENERLSNRNKESERQIEDLLAEIKKLRSQSKLSSDDRDDLFEELETVKAKNNKLEEQKEELNRKIKEDQLICDNYEQEISNLKKQ